MDARKNPTIIFRILMKRIIATADFGSNTCHLIVGSASPGNFKIIADESEWLYLGKEIGTTGEISKDSEKKIIDTVDSFKKTAEKSKAESILIFGTESLRAAKNQKEVLSKVKKKTGVDILLIPGIEEARISHKATMLDTFTSAPSLFVEVGGGSTQVSLCFGSKLEEVISMPIGTSRLLSKSGLAYPASEESVRKIEEIIDEELKKIEHFRQAECLVAAGGLARGIVRALHPDYNRTVKLIELQYIATINADLDEDALQQRYPVKLRRGVTLLPGAIVLSKVMNMLNTDELTVSHFGIREGMVLEILEGNYKANPL